ncbi:MAG: 3-dehydroquinate synthase [Desulfuromonas sp.]|nr:MAG: 3-dehydroquinate synthase [Desulfuromonas sp.]
MKILEVGLDDRSYSISIGQDNLQHLGPEIRKLGLPNRLVVVTNSTIAELYLDQTVAILNNAGFDVESFQIPDGEQYKTLSTLETIFEFLIRHRFDRQSGLVALGGGVVGDIVGFAAACYLRGVPFVQVPTSLLSQVDSSVGGKTAVNHALGKNLIGAFYQPRYVCIDVDILTSLSEREYTAGLAEVVKYGIIRDRDFFDWLCEHSTDLKRRSPEALIHAITRSCQIKADIVELDERESSVRAFLNYGHTLGHAVENLRGYGEVKHGEAVAIGMVAAARLSMRLGLCTEQEVEAISELLLKVGLPVELPVFSLHDYLEVVGRDKKVKGGTLRMILNRGIGNCEIRDVEDPQQLLSDSFPELLNVTKGA